MNCRRLILRSIFALAAILPGKAFGGEIVTLRLATITNLPPYSFDEAGELRGVDVDVAREIAKRAGVTAAIVTMPWARVLLEMESGGVDGAFSMYYVEARKSFLEYVGVMHYDNLGLVSRAERPLAYSGVDSLRGLRIAKGRGVFVSDDFNAGAAAGRFTVIDSDDTQMGNVRMLLLGRVDAVIGVVETMLFYADELGASGKVSAVSGAIDGNRAGYLAISKGSPAFGGETLKARLREATAAVMEDGTYDAILDRYGVPPRN